MLLLLTTMLPEAAKLQAFALRREGHAVKIIAAELGVSERTCHRWFKRDRSSLDPACDAGLDPSLEAEPCARTKAFAMKEAGYRVTEIADDLDVSVATCDRWFRWGDDRSSRPWQQKLTTSQQEALTDFFSTYASASLEDGIHMLRDRFGASVSLSTARKHRVSSCRTTGLRDVLTKLFERHPSATPEELATMAENQYGCKVSLYTVLRYQEYLL